MKPNLTNNTLSVLSISTDHVPESTALALSHSGPPALLWDVLTYAHWGPHGWIFYTSEDQIAAANSHGHPELAKILQFAMDNDFAYVWLDCDAAALPEEVGLPIFSW